MDRRDFIRRSVRPKKPESPEAEDGSSTPSPISLAMMDKPPPASPTEAERSSACVTISNTVNDRLYDQKTQKTSYEVTSSGIAPKKLEFPNRVPTVNRAIPIHLKSFESNQTNGDGHAEDSADVLHSLEQQITEMEKGIALKKVADSVKNNDDVKKTKQNFTRGENTRNSTGGSGSGLPDPHSNVRGRAVSNLLKSGISDMEPGGLVTSEVDGARPTRPAFNRSDNTRSSTGATQPVKRPLARTASDTQGSVVKTPPRRPPPPHHAQVYSVCECYNDVQRQVLLILS